MRQAKVEYYQINLELSREGEYDKIEVHRLVLPNVPEGMYEYPSVNYVEEVFYVNGSIMEDELETVLCKLQPGLRKTALEAHFPEGALLGFLESKLASPLRREVGSKSRFEVITLDDQAEFETITYSSSSGKKTKAIRGKIPIAVVTRKEGYGRGTPKEEYLYPPAAAWSPWWPGEWVEDD